MALGLVLNRSRQVPAEDSPAFGAIAERFRRAGDLERAVSLCQEGLQRFPSHVSARVTLGWSFLDLGRYEEARTELEQALKRAPDNLAAIRGLAELHDRSEHDEVAAMQQSGVKWMAEAAAHSAPTDDIEALHAASLLAELPAMPHASMAAADPLLARVEPAAHASELDESLEAFKAFSAGIDMPPAPADFAKPSAPAPVQTIVAPASVAAPDPLADSPWQPVEIETAAAHVLSAAAAAPVVIAPVVLTSASEVMSSVPVSDFANAMPLESAGLDDFDAPLPVPTSSATSFAQLESLESVESFESLDALDEPIDGTYGLPAVLDTELEMMSDEPMPAFAASASELDPMVPAPVVRPLVLTPFIEMPEASLTPEFVEHDEFDPAMPAGGHEWSEMTADAFVLPAAVEAARATADEGPGPWPPVIPDDPIDEIGDQIGDQIGAPVAIAAMNSTPAAPVTKIRRPNVTALNRFLRRVETRRATVVSQYLAG